VLCVALILMILIIDTGGAFQYGSIPRHLELLDRRKQDEKKKLTFQETR
jgi:hypothetical protein